MPGGGRRGRGFVAHLLDRVDQREVESTLGTKPAPRPLDLVRRGVNGWLARVWLITGLAAGSTRDRADVLAAHALDVARDAGDGAAGAHARHQDADAAVRVRSRSPPVVVS